MSDRAGFFPRGSNKVTGGALVRVFGKKEGRIRITATFLGDVTPCEFYEAIVLTQKLVPFRVQLLKSDTKINMGTKVQSDEAFRHIQLVNIYLRQVGVRPGPAHINRH